MGVKNKPYTQGNRPRPVNFSVSPKGEVGLSIPKTKMFGGEFTAGGSYSPFRKKDKGRIGANIKWKF